MNVFLNIIVFLIIVFLYTHIQYQLKTNNDLEVYEIDYLNKEELYKVCDLRLPVIFDFPENFSLKPYDQMTRQQTSNDVHVFDAQDNYQGDDMDNMFRSEGIELTFSSARDMIKNDKSSRYYSHKNTSFLDEINMTDKLRMNDLYLRPFMTCQSTYDMMVGAKGSYMPMCYHVDFRRYLCVQHGSITVKMSPWKSEKYLHPVNDYENFAFYSAVNVWEPQEKMENDFNKTQFIEVVVPANRILYIPPYWWYSIKFSGEEGIENVVFSYSYKTFMNVLAISPKIALYMLQQQNIKHVFSLRSFTTTTSSASSSPSDDKPPKLTKERIEETLKEENNDDTPPPTTTSSETSSP
jgi:hypothetical protein